MTDLEKYVSKAVRLAYLKGVNDQLSGKDREEETVNELTETIFVFFKDDGWSPSIESEPRTPVDDNVDQYKCQSYFNENNKLQVCSCGRCK